MQGCLLDANHVSAYFNREQKVVDAINAMPVERGVWIATTTLGEIEAGHQMTQTTNLQRRAAFQAWVRSTFSHNKLEISQHTGRYYGDIIGRIFAKHPPSSNKIPTDQWLVSLGVDINDVWVVAVAWEHNLLFVTSDQMDTIREAVNGDVRFANWR